MKKQREKGPLTPPERTDTIRRRIMTLIESRSLSARDISSQTGVPEREVCEHLLHIRKSAGDALIITPPRCKACGFVFKKREKLKKPGKCPACRKQTIEPPRFSIARGREG